MLLIKKSTNYIICDHNYKTLKLNWNVSKLTSHLQKEVSYPILLDNKNEVLSMYGSLKLKKCKETEIEVELKSFNHELSSFFDEVAGEGGWSVNPLMYKEELVAIGITPIPTEIDYK